MKIKHKVKKCEVVGCGKEPIAKIKSQHSKLLLFVKGI